jgi:hypothetical protein
MAAAILRAQFGNFEDCERLARADAIADIYVDVTHVARNLRVHINQLVGLELASQREHMRYLAALDDADRRRDGPVGGVDGCILPLTTRKGSDGEGSKHKKRRGKRLSRERECWHMHGRPVTHWD